MEIILKQHCFTSVDPEFETIGMSEGITADEKLLLEKHSIYFLPGELLYDDKAIKPVKYVFYPLSDHSFVIGRGEYTGKDALGRPGNYFFHNFIIKTVDLLKINAHPVPLIQSLKDEGKYKNSFPGKLESLKYSLDAKDTFPRVPDKLNKKSLGAILHSIYTYHENTYPVVFHGKGEEILDYLDLLFTLLPYDQRIWLSFDTFAFGVPYSFTVFGLPADSFYSHSFFSSVEFYLGSGQITLNREYEMSSVVSSTVDLLFDGKQAIINKLFFVYENFNKKPASFINLISDCDKDFLTVFYGCFKNELMAIILKTVDLVLLNRFIHCIETEEYSRLLNTPGFIDAIAGSSFKVLHVKALEWILNQEKPGEYRLILQSSSLWDIFKKYIDSDETKNLPFPVVSVLVMLIKMCRTCYNPEQEKFILKRILLLTIDPFYYNEDIRKSVYKILKKFPETDDRESLFLRNFFKISSKKKLSDAFFLFDFTQYDRELREIFLAFLLKSVKKVRIKKIGPLAGRLEKVLSDISPVIKFANDELTDFLQNKKKTRAFLKYVHLLGPVEKIYSTSRGNKRIKTFIGYLQQR